MAKDTRALKTAIREMKFQINELTGSKLTLEGPAAELIGPKTLAALTIALQQEPVDGSPFIHPIDMCRTFLGLKEKPGALHERQIQEFHEACDNIGGRKDNKLHADEVPWCSSIWNWIAEKCGMEKTNNALASSWIKYNLARLGDWVEEGDIVVLDGHVTVANKRFNRKTAKSFEGIGGNQGNMVKVSTYPVSRIKAVRVWKPLKGNVVPPIRSSKTGSTANGQEESTR